MTVQISWYVQGHFFLSMERKWFCIYLNECFWGPNLKSIHTGKNDILFKRKEVFFFFLTEKELNQMRTLKRWRRAAEKRKTYSTLAWYATLYKSVHNKWNQWVAESGFKRARHFNTRCLWVLEQNWLQMWKHAAHREQQLNTGRHCTEINFLEECQANQINHNLFDYCCLHGRIGLFLSGGRGLICPCTQKKN